MSLLQNLEERREKILEQIKNIRLCVAAQLMSNTLKQ
jgi:hypothetical protein